MRSHLEGWTLEAHCCSICFGRLVSKRPAGTDHDPPGTLLYRCVNCGLEIAGHTPAVICACGFKVKGRANLGLRCAANPQKTPGFPAEIIATQAQ